LNNRWELLKEERLARILQKNESSFSERPPETFTSAVYETAGTWRKERAARHQTDKLIYHYCDAPALLNILRSRAVWATSTKYLNDSTEMLSFTANMRQHADQHRATVEGQTLADMVDFYWVSSDTRQSQTIGMDRFACCFSADGDLLSQWRAYGNDGRGYAIGFDPRRIAGLSEPQPMMTLRRMAYGDEDEARLIGDLIERFAPAIAAHLDILDTTGWSTVHTRNWLSMRFGECLLDLVEEVKDASFAEEKEWRLYASCQKTEFRVSADRIVPYRLLDLSSSDEPEMLPIGEIVIGPRLDFNEAAMSLMTYTSTLGYGTGMNFRKSKAPYR